MPMTMYGIREKRGKLTADAQQVNITCDTAVGVLTTNTQQATFKLRILFSY